MSIRLKSNSGQYDLAETERMVNQLGAAHEQLSTVQCVIHFLDDSQQTFQIDRNSFGQAILDAAFDSLELLDRDYFGLQFFDSFFQENAVSCTPLPNGFYAVWLDPTRPLRKQINSAPPYVFYLRVKFYASDPCRLQDEYTRYHFCLQLRKDLAEGRLHVPHNVASILASFLLQSELGDYNPDEHRDNYVSEFRFAPGQNEELEAEIGRLHRMHVGQSPTEAEMNLLNRAKFLDYYGMRLYAASDAQNRPVQVGVSANGMALFAGNANSNSAKLDAYGWSRILRLLFKKEQFFVHLRPDTYLLSNAKSSVQVQPSSVVTFTLDSARSAKHLWKVCVEHHTFYRLHKLPAELVNSIQQGGALKKFGSFSGASGSAVASTVFNRYSGRTEHQTLEDGRRRARVERTFQRTPSKRHTRRVGGSSIQSLASAAGGSYAPHAASAVGGPLQRAGSLQSASSSLASGPARPPPANAAALNKLRAQATSPQPSYTSSTRDGLSPFRDGSSSGMSSANSTLTNAGNKRSYETTIGGDEDDTTSVSTSAQQSAAQSAKLATTVSQLIGQLEAEQEQTRALLERNEPRGVKSPGTATPQTPTSPTGRAPNEVPLRPSRQSAAITSPPSGADSIALKPLPPDPTAFRKPSMPVSRTSGALNTQATPSSSTTQPNLAATATGNNLNVTPTNNQNAAPATQNAPAMPSVPNRNSSLNPSIVSSPTNGSATDNALSRPAGGAQPLRESFYGGLRRNYVNMNNEPTRNSVHGAPSLPPKPTNTGVQQPPAVPKALTSLGSNAHPQSPPGIAVPAPKPAPVTNAVQLAAKSSSPSNSVSSPPPSNNMVRVPSMKQIAQAPSNNVAPPPPSNNMVRVPSMKQIAQVAPLSAPPPTSPPASLVRGGSRATVDSRAEQLRERAASPVSIGSQLSDAAFTASQAVADSKQLIHVRIRPDAQGRYGLNVKGGVDQQLPIVISKIASGMPADCAVPRLNEGDQVVTICDQDASRLSHADVVALIRSRGQAASELTLSVRPSLYYLAVPLGTANAGGSEEFSDYEKWLKQQVLASTAAQQQSDFELSLDYLRNSLKSRAILEQFERVPRRKAATSMNVALNQENVAKNRYRDILPYDQTRVVLTPSRGDSATDYVNASHIEIEVPSTGIVTRYIAAQGPLDCTANDFWALIWQQQCTFIVMLTQCVEKGRAKCHQYWPPLYETSQCGRYEVTCLREQQLPSASTPAYCSREFVLIDVRTNEERRVTQLHYLRWLDHSVPDNEEHFTDFLLKLREIRVGHIAPMLVHCSAGIGRTGVLILIETLLILIENRRPLNLLYFVNLMRMQRALLIQTQEQFAFSCELVLRMFDRGLVRPHSNGTHKLSGAGTNASQLNAPPPPRGQKFVV